MAKAIDVNRKAKSVRRGRRLEMASTIPLPKTAAKPKRSATIRMHYEPGQYERIFGKTEAQRQKEFHDQLEAQKRAQTTEADAPRGFAVHGENKGAGRRLYGNTHKGIFDWGLGRTTYGRSDRRRAMQEVGRAMGGEGLREVR